jgi:hypothetical protein
MTIGQKRKRKRKMKEIILFMNTPRTDWGEIRRRGGKTPKMLMIDETFSATNKSAQTLSQCLLRTLNGPKTN